jgi:hypothetical protein
LRRAWVVPRVHAAGAILYVAGSRPGIRRRVVRRPVSLIISLALPGVCSRVRAIVYAFASARRIPHALRIGAIRIIVIRHRSWLVVGIQIVVVVEAVVIVIVVDVDVRVAVVDRAVVIATAIPRVVNWVVRRRIIGSRTIPHAPISPRRVVVIVAVDRLAHSDPRSE